MRKGVENAGQVMSPTVNSDRNAELAAKPGGKKARKWWVLAVGGAIAAILVVVGVVLQMNYQGRNEEGVTVGEMEAKMGSLEEEAAGLAEVESLTFNEEGFSEDFYTRANERAEVELEKEELENAIEDQHKVDAEANVVQTGAIFCFIIAAIVVVMAMTIFLVL